MEWVGIGICAALLLLLRPAVVRGRKRALLRLPVQSGGSRRLGDPPSFQARRLLPLVPLPPLPTRRLSPYFLFLISLLLLFLFFLSFSPPLPSPLLSYRCSIDVLVVVVVVI